MKNTIKVNSRYYDKVIKIMDLASAINAGGIHYAEVKVVNENNIVVITNHYKHKSYSYFDIDFESNLCDKIIEKCLLTLEDLEYDNKLKK